MNDFTKADREETIKFFIRDELISNCGKFLDPDLVDKIAKTIFSNVMDVLENE